MPTLERERRWGRLIYVEVGRITAPVAAEFAPLAPHITASNIKYLSICEYNRGLNYIVLVQLLYIMPTSRYKLYRGIPFNLYCGALECLGP